MRKYFLLLIAFFTFAFANAQSLRLGLRAGGGLSSVRNHPLSDDFTYKFKLHGGLVFNLPVSHILHLQAEALYSQKGFEHKTGATANYESAFLDVPLLAHLNIGALFVEAGPQASFLLSSKRNEADFKGSTKSTVFGYLAGLGYQANHFQYSLRYVTDLSDPYVSLLGSKAGRHAGFQLSVGYIVNY